MYAPELPQFWIPYFLAFISISSDTQHGFRAEFLACLPTLQQNISGKKLSRQVAKYVLEVSRLTLISSTLSITSQSCKPQHNRPHLTLHNHVGSERSDRAQTKRDRALEYLGLVQLACSMTSLVLSLHRLLKSEMKSEKIICVFDRNMTEMWINNVCNSLLADPPSRQRAGHWVHFY